MNLDAVLARLDDDELDFLSGLDEAVQAELFGRDSVDHAKANVNGESMRGFYFRATDGSAQGVAWQAAVDVWRARQIGPDVFFAHDSRIGTKLQPD